MLKLSEFCHNHHPSGVKMLAKFIRRGFSVIGIYQLEKISHVGRAEHNNFRVQ